jgi:hypothetical protein
MTKISPRVQKCEKLILTLAKVKSATDAVVVAVGIPGKFAKSSG